VRAAGGIIGDLHASSHRRQQAGVWLGLGLVLGVALLTIVMKGLDRPASIEEAERVIREEFSLSK
jgi:hypothetical protein